MTFGIYPIAELGVLWLQATLCVAFVWFFFCRTYLMPVIVATALVYTLSILAWMTMVKFDVPTLWELTIAEREYPIAALTALGLACAYLVLNQMKRRKARKDAIRRASMTDQKIPEELLREPPKSVFERMRSERPGAP